MSNVIPFPRSAAKPTITLTDAFALLIQHARTAQHDPAREPAYRTACARLVRGAAVQLQGVIQC